MNHFIRFIMLTLGVGFYTLTTQGANLQTKVGGGIINCESGCSVQWGNYNSVIVLGPGAILTITGVPSNAPTYEPITAKFSIRYETLCYKKIPGGAYTLTADTDIPVQFNPPSGPLYELMFAVCNASGHTESYFTMKISNTLTPKPATYSLKITNNTNAFSPAWKGTDIDIKQISST